MKSLKYDTDKPRLSLIVPSFLIGLARVLTFGAGKYDAWNWLASAGSNDHDDFRDRCYDALQRHLLALQEGEYLDQDSKMPHIYHAACNVMFIAYYDTITHEERHEHDV